MRYYFRSAVLHSFFLIVLMTLASSSLMADRDADGWAAFASGTGNKMFIAVGVTTSLFMDGKAGKQNSIRTIDALLASATIASGLKRLTHEERPDDSSADSFPSGHATAAFTLAAMQSEFRPKQAPFWYAGAAIISASRVSQQRHYVHDVLAGAALGYLTAHHELSHKNGLVLTPFIKGGYGVRLKMDF